MAAAPPTKVYRYYDFVMAGFVVVLLCSNVVASAKVCQIGPITFGSGIILFPLSYVFGDIMTEVYGYARARRIVWAGFVGLVFASVLSWIILALPASPNWPHQKAYEVAFGATPRIAFASLIAFFVGEFTNTYVLAKMKILTEGRFLWARTIGSTIVGEGVDSAIFYPLAFAGLWSTEILIKVLISNYLLKVLWEIVMTPLTYKIVAFLKRAENEDYFDRNTNFSPFTFRAD
jgi:uncharacterized integral membrane protein (TIGR00697 family)